MKRWAVGFYSQFDNELSIMIVEALTWDLALAMHPLTKSYGLENNKTLEDAKRMAFDNDAMVDVVEIP